MQNTFLGSFFGGFTEDKNDRVERIENELNSPLWS